ncbi:MAG: NfeD family protein [Rhodopseudomonas sp.]|nr:NfeD family protein [Rhodopseudomonas sp.]
MNPWIWAIAALVAAIAEIVVPGFYLIWLAAGAAIAALASFAFGLTLTGQLFLFAIASILSCIAGYFAYRRLDRLPADAAMLNQRGLEMVGTTGTVYEAIRNGRGKVNLGDSVWLAEGPDLDAGAAVVVTGLRGTVAVVAAR